MFNEDCNDFGVKQNEAGHLMNEDCTSSYSQDQRKKLSAIPNRSTHVWLFMYRLQWLRSARGRKGSFDEARLHRIILADSKTKLSVILNRHIRYVWLFDCPPPVYQCTKKKRRQNVPHTLNRCKCLVVSDCQTSAKRCIMSSKINKQTTSLQL